MNFYVSPACAIPEVGAPAGFSEAELGSQLRRIRLKLDDAAFGTLMRKQEQEVSRLVEAIRKVTEWLVWGERHQTSFFDLFCEHTMLVGFVCVLRTRASPRAVKLQVLQTLSILMQNVQRSTSMIYLLSGDLLNAFFDDPPGLEDEEMLAYFVSLLKSLALRLDDETAQLCLVAVGNDIGMDVGCGQTLWFSKRMPVFECALRLVGHGDLMVKTAARSTVLCLLRLNSSKVRAATEEASAALLAPRLAKIASEAGQPTEGWRAADTSDIDELMQFVLDIFNLNIQMVARALEYWGFGMDENGRMKFLSNQNPDSLLDWSFANLQEEDGREGARLFSADKRFKCVLQYFHARTNLPCVTDLKNVKNMEAILGNILGRLDRAQPEQNAKMSPTASCLCPKQDDISALSIVGSEDLFVDLGSSGGVEAFARLQSRLEAHCEEHGWEEVQIGDHLIEVKGVQVVLKRIVTVLDEIFRYSLITKAQLSSEIDNENLQFGQMSEEIPDGIDSTNGDGLHSRLRVLPSQTFSLLRRVWRNIKPRRRSSGDSIGTRTSSASSLSSN